MKAGNPRKGKGVAMAFIQQHVNYQHDDCLPWPFARLHDGYGIGNHEGKRFRAPRVMCELAHGPAPSPDHQAAHSCGKGHEGCINPRHLSWKTRKENRADRTKHGRDRWRPRWKLTAEQVAEIRASTETAELVAKRFGVTRQNIYQVRNRITWVTGERVFRNPQNPRY